MVLSGSARWAEPWQWNRSPGTAEDFARLGAHKLERPEEAFTADATITMLADDAIRLVLVPSGALECMPNNMVDLVMSAISVDFARELERAHSNAGVVYVAAPVLGQPDAAAAGKLHILACGDRAALARVQPCSRPWASEFGRLDRSRTRPKLVLNFLLTSAIEAIAEATALADCHELNPTMLMDVVTGSLVGAPAYKTYGEMTCAGNSSLL